MFSSEIAQYFGTMVDFLLILARCYVSLKTGIALFSRKINFCPNLGKKGPNSFLVDFLKNFAFNCSWKSSKMETNIVVISPPISYLAKFKFLMLSANQIAGFFKK